MAQRAAMIGAAAAGLIAGAAAVWAAGQSSSPPIPAAERMRIESVVHDYILAHPEILPQAMEKLRDTQSKSAIDADRAAIETPFAGAWAGAKDADVTLVEFTDYACGYCRRTVPDLDRLLATDTKLRIVWREIPILSPESQVAAQAALAAAQHGSYQQIHHALFDGGQLTAAKIAAAAKAAGVPAAGANDPKVRAEIANNLAIAARIGIEATPTFVIGDQMLAGAIGYDALKQAVDTARARKR